MKIKFKSCINRNACTEDGTHCRSCGRSHDEIIRTRLLVNTVSAFLHEMEYENTEEFLEYFSKKVGKKLAHSRKNSINL